MLLATLHSPISYFQAIVLGLLQGITELFPVSSLGHSVVLPQLFGWTSLVKAQSASSSYFLTFLVGLHVATALGMLLFFIKDWIRIISALLVSIKERRIQNADARLGWLLVIATIPAGIMGLVFEKLFRTLFARPLAAAIFLVINGIILLVGERARQKSESRALARSAADSRELLGKSEPTSRVLETLDFKESVIIGVAQVFALLAGISRSGITMVAGLLRGLNHEDAARFSFLLATPIIFAAGVYKLPSLLSSNASAVRPEILVGAVFAFIAAFFSVRFLTKYFQTRNLYPFAAYCLAFGSLLVIRFV